MADKTARTGPDDDTAASKPDRPTAGAADAPSGHAPPPMPTAAGIPFTNAPAPPPMPTAAGIPFTNAPPPMPTAAGIPFTNAPPPMPTAAGASSSTAAPTMPTLAGAVLDTAPPAMPIPAGTVIPEHLPPAMPPEYLPAAMPSDQLSPVRYALGREIARGGMGRVVDATDTMLDRVVAFKEALTTDGDTLRRFQREIRITARLEHPSIVPVHDTGESSSGTPFYVMRKVSGQPLERLVANAETLNQRLALIPHIVASAQAIAHAHERGIVHRDIKPSNILVGELGETVVIDWGLAKVIGEPDEPLGKPLVDLSDSLKTRVGIVYGTPGFMAPEQLRGVPVTAGFDVYALGATLYHLLSRTPPHYAKTADEMMKAAVAAPPTPIRELVEGVPLDLSTIVDKALAHDPEVRYPNARALAEDLQRFLTGQLVASHHYSPREKLVRFIRRNRGVSAAVAALLVVGTISVIRIINERDRADRAARQAILRAEQLTLAQARSNVDVDPTKSVAMVKPLVAKYWREVRAIGAAARAAGVAWSAPASKETLSLEMSHDGRRALSAGDDGVVRIHDLDQRTTRPILDLHTRAMARFADAERQILIWPEHGTSLVVLDARTGQRRDLTTSHAIASLEVAGSTAYWIDDQRALWQLELARTVPTRIPLEEPVVALAPSPDGRWLALASDHHLFLYDRTQPTAPLRQVIQGSTRDLQWSTAGPAPDGEHLAAVIAQQNDDLAIDVAVTSGPETVKRRTLASRQTAANPRFVAVSRELLYVVSRSGVAIVSHDADPTPCEQRESHELYESPEPPVAKQISGYPVGIVESRGGTIVAGATDGLTVISADGDRVLPLAGAHIEGVLASPRSPYVIALLEHRLLVWNLDDVQPRRLTNERSDGARFATSDQVITGGIEGADNLPAQSIDVVTATARPLGDWPGLRAVTAPDGGHVAAVLDGAKHVHVIGPGRPPEDLPGEIDIAGFATQDQLVLATPGGEIYVHDVARHQRTPLVPPHAPLLGLAWGHGHHPWVAAAFADGTLWRKNLATGASATIARTPALDLAHPTDRDGKLLAGKDGTVLFLHDREVHAWRANGGIERLANLPKPILDFGEAGTSHVLAFANDRTIYTIASAAPDQVTEARPSINDVAASMSPDTGLLVALDRGDLNIIDPLGNWQWRLAPASGVTFADPVISTDGRRVLAQATSHVRGRPEHSLVVWSIELPATPADTAKWLDAMTNAVEDPGSPGLGWR